MEKLTFRDVVHSYGNSQTYSKSGCGQANNESGDALRKVVDGNGSSCNDNNI